MRSVVGALMRIDAAILRPVAGIFLLVMMFAISINALSRGFLDTAIGWVIPLVTSLAMPAVVFFGLPALTLDDGHVRMEAVTDRIPQGIRVQLRRLGWLVGIVALSYIGYANTVTAWSRRGHGIGADSVIPATFQYGMVAASCFLTALILLTYLIRPGLVRRAQTETDVAASEI